MKKVSSILHKRYNPINPKLTFQEQENTKPVMQVPFFGRIYKYKDEELTQPNYLYTTMKERFAIPESSRKSATPISNEKKPFSKFYNFFFSYTLTKGKPVMSYDHYVQDIKKRIYYWNEHKMHPKEFFYKVKKTVKGLRLAELKEDYTDEYFSNRRRR